jgi:hypothetical protein
MHVEGLAVGGTEVQVSVSRNTFLLHRANLIPFFTRTWCGLVYAGAARYAQLSTVRQQLFASNY